MARKSHVALVSVRDSAQWLAEALVLAPIALTGEKLVTLTKQTEAAA